MRGYKQVEYVDFDPDEIYAPFATDESIRIMFSISPSEDLIFEGADVDNAYLEKSTYQLLWSKNRIPVESSHNPICYASLACHLAGGGSRTHLGQCHLQRFAAVRIQGVSLRPTFVFSSTLIFFRLHGACF